MPAGRPREGQGGRVVPILQAITDAGGKAGTQEIWLRVNRDRWVMSLGVVHRLMPAIRDKGHVVLFRADPAIWAITPAGERWLKGRT